MFTKQEYTSPHSKKIFRMQKRIVRIMMGCRRLVSCRSLLKKSENTAPRVSMYIFRYDVYYKAQTPVHSKLRNSQHKY
jgi:hypothetical protein